MDRAEKGRLRDWLEILDLMKLSYYHSVPFEQTPETMKVDRKLEEYLVKYGESFDINRYVSGASGWQRTVNISLRVA